MEGPANLDVRMTTPSCPYCNALVGPTADGGLPAACPRCGESLARLGPGSPSAGLPFRDPVAGPVPPGSPARRWTWVVALLVAGLATGLIAWRPWEQGSSPTDVPEDAPRAVVAPADLPGLGYLPASTEAIVAIQLPLLIERLGPDAPAEPAEALKRFGVPDAVIDVVERASGVGLANVDQLVVGLDFTQAAFPPRTVVVVHTRRPFDLDQVARQAKANELKRGRRTLKVARFNPIVDLNWWAPTDRVLIATLLPKDYDAIPIEPRTGVDHLQGDIARLIRAEVAPDACAWVAAASDRWHDYLRPYTLLPLTPLRGRNDLLAPAARLRTVTLAVPTAADQRVDLRIGLKTEAAAEELRGSLKERFRGEAITVSGEGTEVQVQTDFDPGRLGSLITRLAPGRK